MASQTKRQKSSDAYKLLYGTCPDEECQAKLFFPSYDKSIECTSCGQRHEKSQLRNVAEVTNPDVALHNLLKNVLFGKIKPKKGPDDVKVLGLSNYVCKLISPLLTYYGMDKDHKAKLLSEMGKGHVFDVSVLGDRAFVIEEDNLNLVGYGRDRSGSAYYLAETLRDIEAFNDNETRLVPIHADGDGHCLVHAISRALVGRELFWHALRINLKNHMANNLDKYKLLFEDFVDTDEWGAIIEECDPEYLPPLGEAHGLRNIHIFGLANVLHRPIILLDSRSGMHSSGDYSGVFLPGLVEPEQCRGKDGSLNKPLCIAWSSLGRNHYIPIVAVKGKEPAKLPSYMVQKSWGMPKETIKKYIDFDQQFRCTVGGDKCLTERYLKQLVSSMADLYTKKYDVNPDLVADVHQYIYKSSGIVGGRPDEVLERTRAVVQSGDLYRCLLCEALVEFILDRDQFERGGAMYNLAVKIHHKLDQTKLYSFPTIGAVCSYDEKQDCLIPDKARSKPKQCTFCSGTTLRQVRADGSNVYENGDRTTTPCVGGKCLCGFKHYWDGKEYDNLPEIYPVSLSWGGKTVSEEIPWFQDESNIALNSNVYEVAQNIVQKHFPGVFGSERLVQHVVDTILAQSAASYKEKNATESATLPETGEQEDGFDAEMASKIILTGPAKKTLHKEELVKSEKEKLVRQNIQAHAPKLQVKRASQNPSHKLVKTLHVAAPRGIPVLGTIVRDKLETETEAGSQSAFQSTSDQSVHKEKKVRLQTSDGRQVMLTLVEEVTYSALQRLIYEAVNVPEDRQRLRMGFPPKLLEAPPAGKEQVLDIKHGDKIALEILPDHTTSREDIELDVEATTVGAQGSSEEAHSSMSWTSFEKDIQNQNAETLLQALKNANQGGDSLDTSIASLTILSAVEGKDFWSYVQGMPHLFSVGGLLYQQVKRDMGLVDGKHCQLPCLPGKVFRYSATEDRLELCLEPDGHFQVQPNIEARVKERSVTDPRTEVKFGGSGAIHHGSDRPAFGGQGHSLKSTLTTEARMPGDLQYIPHHPHARGIKDLCSPPGSHQNTIDEETEEGMQTEQSAEVGKEEVLYHRLGPGYSVIDHSEMNDANRNLEMFRALSEHIERTLTQVTEEMEEDEESDQNVNASKGDPTLNDECSKTEAVVTECVDVIEVANALDVAKKEISNSNMDDRLFICSKLCPENHTESEKDEDVSKMQVDVAKTEEEISITEGTNMHLIEENRITSFEDRMDANNENLPTTEVFSCLEKPTDQREATFESKAGHEPENLNKDLVNETLESSTENK